MKRVNGYRDLDEYFKRILKRKTIDKDILEKKKVITTSIDGANPAFWFKYFNVPIIFKENNNEYSIFSELISEELAKHLNIKSAQYDIATFEGKKGVISYDFKKEGYTYLCIGDILDFYINKKELLDPKNENAENTYGEYYLRCFSRMDQNDMVNNFHDIWNALEYYLLTHNYADYLIPELVEKIMIQFTDYFVFQIISGNFDMHSGNISIGLADDKSDIELSPLYDNEDMFEGANLIDYISPYTPRLSITRKNIIEEEDYLDILKEYLTISDDYFIARFKNMLNKIDDNTIVEIIKLVEERIEIEIPYDIKYNIALYFNKNLKLIKELDQNINIHK